MKVHRSGTDKRIKAKLARHHELMQRFMLEGFDREAASALALRVMSHKPEEVHEATKAYMSRKVEGQ